MGYFDDLVSNFGGQSNAYTDNTNTNYYFAIASKHFDQALKVI
jgi:predicted Zn-dependent peptidase